MQLAVKWLSLSAFLISNQHNDINTSYHIYRAKQGGVALPFDEVDDADPRLFASQRAKGISLLSKKEGHVYSMFQLYWITSTTGILAGEWGILLLLL